MRLETFSPNHAAEAAALAYAGYQEEREHVPALPVIADVPPLAQFAGNGLGAAAFDGGRMVGFLCTADPFEHAFGSTNVRGVFSPMGAHGAVRVNREKIYAHLYQFAAEKWVRAGAMSHSICLYAHDEAAHRLFFRYGFGERCVDAVRTLEPVRCASGGAYELEEVPAQECQEVYPFEVALHRHFLRSPFFMNRSLADFEAWRAEKQQEKARWFVAKHSGRMCAYLEISRAGETFISESAEYAHVTGAYCVPEHRGSGMYADLLRYAMAVLQREGYRYLGTDYESINPAAAGFWPKHFQEYTHGVVRRIDERIAQIDTSSDESFEMPNALFSQSTPAK